MRFLALLVLVVVVGGCIQEEQTTTTIPVIVTENETSTELGGIIITASGFGDFKPLVDSVKYENDVFTFRAINSKELPMKDLKVNKVGGDCTDLILSTPSLPPGESISATGTSCNVKSTNESFRVSIQISYNVTIENHDIARREDGEIRGGIIKKATTTTIQPETTTSVSLDQCTPTTTSFGKLKLILNETRLTTDGNFTGVFMNGVGQRIELYDISVRNTITNTSCSKNFTIGNHSYLFPLPVPEGRVYDELKRSGIKIEYYIMKSGEMFSISSANCNNNETKKPGDKFTLNVTIRYFLPWDRGYRLIGSGIITGCYE